MATIIYNTPNPVPLTEKNMTLLANMYHESEYTTEWDPCDDIPDKLIITDAPLEIIFDMFAEEDIVSYDEALKLLAGETTNNTPTDIATPAEQLPRPCDRDEISVTEGIYLLLALIEHELIKDETPEHIKADLRCLQAIVHSIIKHYPFTPESGEVSVVAGQYRCTSGMREIMREIMVIYEDAFNGKYHVKRGQDSKSAEIEKEANA